MSRIRINQDQRVTDPNRWRGASGLEAREFHRRLPEYRATPLRNMSTLAERLGIGSLQIKDESSRFGLPAFKILGASYAVYRLAQRVLAFPTSGWSSFEELQSLIERLPPRALVTATDGNHGRGVARVARWFDLPSRVYMPRGTAMARIEGIESEGASVTVVDGGYEDAVEQARQDAERDERTWLVQDTAWPGYEVVPSWIVEGYSTLLWEIDSELRRRGEPAPDLIVVQIGVGSFAAAVVRHSRSRWPNARLVGVEPVSAACAFRSIEARRPVTVPGPHDSIMAGLNCGEVSSLAWPILRDGLDAVMTIDDETCVEAMRLLAREDARTSESGAAGLAGLLDLLEMSHRPDEVAAHPETAVLLFMTEGITDVEGYRRFVSSST